MTGYVIVILVLLAQVGPYTGRYGYSSTSITITCLPTEISMYVASLPEYVGTPAYTRWRNPLPGILSPLYQAMQKQ